MLTKYPRLTICIFAATALVQTASLLVYHEAAAQSLQPESLKEVGRVFGTATPPQQPQDLGNVNYASKGISLTTAINSSMNPAMAPNTSQRCAVFKEGTPVSYVMGWHGVTLDTTVIDHGSKLLYDQNGPARTSRAFGLLHLAMFETVNRIPDPSDRVGQYASLLWPPFSHSDWKPKNYDKSVKLAVTQAAFETLSWLYPKLIDPTTKDDAAQGLSVPGNADPCITEKFSLTRYYKETLIYAGYNESDVEDAAAVGVGHQVAQLIRMKYTDKQAELPEPIIDKDIKIGDKKTDPLSWQIDPVSGLGFALGGNWRNVAPMVLPSAAMYRPEPNKYPFRKYTPSEGATKKDIETILDKIKDIPSYGALVKYAGEYRYGLPGLSNPNDLNEPRDGYFIAQFWAYDGTSGLCAPARLYNEIADEIIKIVESDTTRKQSDFDSKDVLQLARYYALVNIALADAAIAAWDSKYYFQFSRPVTAIRAYQSYLRSKNPSEEIKNFPPDGAWFPVGAQISNSKDGRNITPPFPSYPSGHAVFGGALFGVLRQFVSKPDSFRFQFQSDEFNGHNTDAFNYVRCSDIAKNPDGTARPAEKDRVNFCGQDHRMDKPKGTDGRREFDFDCAERENADSRIFMGVHWIEEANDGIEMGNRVADYVYRNAFKPTSGNLALADFRANEKNKTCPGVKLPSDWVKLTAVNK